MNTIMALITSIEELIFPVELKPIYTNLEINGKSEEIKVPNSRVVINTQSGKPLGVVSKNYKLITNKEALELGEKGIDN